jgi:hypothetical protein
MTTAQRTWSTNHIENEAAYSAAIKRNIINNALKTWLANTERAEEILTALNAGRVINVEVTVKATIKAHDTRDGVKQTIISRPKIID